MSSTEGTLTPTAANNDDDDRSLSSKHLDIIAIDLSELESQSMAKICPDETNLEQNGYRFNRQTAILSKPGCMYYAEKVPTKQSDQQQIVCKIIPLDNFPRTRDKENFLANSIRIIRFVCGYNRPESRHRTFVRVYEIFKIESKIYIFMDECKGNNILQMIKHHEKFTQNEGRKWIESLCDAILFLHSRGVAHRSIKMENIIIHTNSKNNEPQHSQPKLCGLNRSVIYVDRMNSNKILKQKRETRSFDYYHLPPESFHRSNYNPAIADIWSLGVILIAIHTKRYVFNVKSKIDFNQQWKIFAKKHEINPIVANLLDGIFQNNPSKRLKLKSIMDHEYFRVAEEQQIEIKEQTETRMMMMDKNNENENNKSNNVETTTPPPPPIQPNDEIVKQSADDESNTDKNNNNNNESPKTSNDHHQ